jgi:hypothetical protein
MRLSRRAVVAALLAAGGGCLDGSAGSTPTATATDGDGDSVPDRVDDYPDDPDRAFRSLRAAGTVTLRPGEFDALALTNSPRAGGEVLHYDVSVVGEGTVDCLVLEREAYDAYQQGARDVPVVEAYSRTGVTETALTSRLATGEFLFVLDNTDLAGEASAEPLTVSRVVELAEPAGTERP